MGYSKVFAIGVDGGTLELVQPWAQAGKLPTFARMMAQGAVGELESTIPPITGPAWASFMTGKNPGGHGVGDWMRSVDGDSRKPRHLGYSVGFALAMFKAWLR